MFERKFPPQNNAKSRERSDRNIDENRRGTAGAAASVEFGGAGFMARSGVSQKISFYYNARSSRLDVTGADSVSSKTPKLETRRVGDMKKWIALGVTVVLGALVGVWAAQAQETMRPPGPRGAEGMRMGRPGELGMGMEGLGRGGERGIYRRLLALLDNDRVKAALGLTDQQTNGLRELAVDTEKATVKTEADIEVRGIELRELLRADQPDHDAAVKKVEEISALRADLMKRRIEALLKAKSLLTPEQQKKIRTFVEERRAGNLGMMRPGGGMRPYEQRAPRGPATPPPPANPPNGEN
jgi:Spy/CpxP family protein refolding chaperone